MAEETKLITISMESIESDVMKQVSAIAKRQKDKAGDSLFGNTTLHFSKFFSDASLHHSPK